MSETTMHIRPRWLILAVISCLPPMPALAQAPAGNRPYSDRSMLHLAPPRDISDQDHARSRTQSGENRSFNELLSSAQRVGRGEFLAVEPDISTNIYRFRFMRPTGNIIWVDVDGRTGRVVAERE